MLTPTPHAASRLPPVPNQRGSMPITNLSSLNLAMTPEEEEIADHLADALDENSTEAVRNSAAGKIAHGVKNAGIQSLKGARVLESLRSGFASKSINSKAGAHPVSRVQGCTVGSAAVPCGLFVAFAPRERH